MFVDLHAFSKYSGKPYHITVNVPEILSIDEYLDSRPGTKLYNLHMKHKYYIIDEENYEKLRQHLPWSEKYLQPV